jgi:sigma-B regulation protein RsbU (phosphoserine phosphatase)
MFSSGYLKADYHLQQCNILVADDVENNRLLIQNILNQAGYYNLIFAADGKEALAMLEEYDIDLILLDLVMPNMDGYEVCRQVRLQEEKHHRPIVVQSVHDSPEEKAKAFQAGATDFINKPIAPLELISRIRIHLTQYELFKEMSKYQARVNEEMSESRKMLFSLIPKDSKHPRIGQKYNVHLSSVYRPSLELGGDYYGVREVSDDKISIYIWDFSGHGVTSAINTFRLHSLIQNLMSIRDDPAKFLNRINENLRNMLSVEQYATMFYSVYDTRTDKLTFAAAGSCDPFLISFDNKKVKKLSGEGFPLSVTSEPNYSNHVIDMKNWDTIFLYSDALTETTDVNGNFLDLEGLIIRLVENSEIPPGTNRAHWLLEHVQNVFNARYASRLVDDLTINVLSKMDSTAVRLNQDNRKRLLEEAKKTQMAASKAGKSPKPKANK